MFIPVTTLTYPSIRIVTRALIDRAERLLVGLLGAGGADA
jgi:hypothetical protein